MKTMQIYENQIKKKYRILINEHPYHLLKNNETSKTINENE